MSRAAAVATPADGFFAAPLAERDPENRLFSHQAKWRLPAESIRDNALFVSGLLTLDVGGPTAKPYPRWCSRGG